jgi:transposase
VEATRNWYWFVDMLQERGVKVHLANPKQTKAISWGRKKGDKVDAETLCRLLESGYLPTCWTPDKKTRDLREIVRYRIKLVRIRTQLKNMIRSYFSKQNIPIPMDNLWTLKGTEWLRKTQIKYPHNEMKKYCLRLIDEISKVIEIYDKKLEKLSKKTKEIEILETIPYVGYNRALTIITETGPIEMFKRAKSYVACCGLAPTTKSSGGKIRHGRLSKEARLVLKWTFIEIANQAYSVDSDLSEYFYRIQCRRGKNIAKISLARKIAKGVYHMLKNKISFEEYKRVYMVG